VRVVFRETLKASLQVNLIISEIQHLMWIVSLLNRDSR